MAVYVDAVRPCIPNAVWKHAESCHMIADTTEELHAFGKRIGLRRDWFQGNHYDLTAHKRLVAIEAGAIALDRHDFVKQWRLRNSTEAQR